MTVRYFVPELPGSGGAVELPEAESHHACTVMRIRPGESVVLFDGRGNEAEATVQSVSRRSVACEAEPVEFLPRANLRDVTLGVAMPKGDRARDLIERLTELGIERIVPLQCQRSPWSVSEGAIGKWQRVVIEACKQSGRNGLMLIDPPCRLSDYFARPLGEDEIGWLAHPGGETIQLTPGGGTTSVDPQSADPPCQSPSAPVGPRVRIAVGPEGGFTDEESAAAGRAGWTQVGLGERIYRIETAAIILAIKAAGI